MLKPSASPYVHGQVAPNPSPEQASNELYRTDGDSPSPARAGEGGAVSPLFLIQYGIHG